MPTLYWKHHYGRIEKSPSFLVCSSVISPEKFKSNTKLHLLGFGKIERIKEFYKYNLYSIDTTSPLLRAFKDKRQNLFMPGDKKSILNYYTAFRIPQSTENRNLMKTNK